MPNGVLDKTKVPYPGYFKCRQPGLAEPIRHPYFIETKNKVIRYRKANGLPISGEFDREFEDCVCAEQPEICGEIETGEAPPANLGERLLKFGRSMMKWKNSGWSVVEPAVYEQRWQACLGCEFWNGEPYFGYGRCLKCGCSRLKLLATTESCPIGKW